MKVLLYMVGSYIIAPIACLAYGSTIVVGKKLIKDIGRCKCGVCRQYKDPIH